MYITDNKDRFIVARWCYLMGQPILSDIEYDALEKEFKANYPDSDYSKHTLAFDKCPTELLQKYGLSSLICNPVMGYMAESIDSINTWEDFYQVFTRLNKLSRLSFKIDGWNMRVSYYNGTLVEIRTRGRSGTNLSANGLAPMFPKTIPYKGRVAITGECNIPNDKWKLYKMITGNSDQRASVRTALANTDVDYLQFLAFEIKAEDDSQLSGDHYDILKSLGFKTPYFKWVNNVKTLEAAIRYMSLLSKTYNFLVDGLVIENEDYQYAIRLGEWEEKSNNSYVVGYDEMPGMYGVSMVVKIHPTVIEGKTFTRVNITNIAQIIDNELEIGSPIAFNIRSAANIVVDATGTYTLQTRWANRYEEYREIIDKGGD